MAGRIGIQIARAEGEDTDHYNTTTASSYKTLSSNKKLTYTLSFLNPIIPKRARDLKIHRWIKKLSLMI